MMYTDNLQIHKFTKPVNPKGSQHWIFIGRTDTETEAPILWPRDVKSWLLAKDPYAGKDWGQEGNRGWDGWMAPLTQCRWVWANSGRWWRTRKPSVLQSMGSQRVGHDWLTTTTKGDLGSWVLAPLLPLTSEERRLVKFLKLLSLGFLFIQFW